MYKIGEFSRITQLSIKTLRYYDEQEILKPSFREEHTGYRYYDEHDFERAELIQLLRSFEFTIAEIKDVINTCENREDINFYITEKRNQIAEDMRRKQQLLDKLKEYEKPTSQTQIEPVYEIKEIRIEETLIAGYRFKGKYQELGNHIGKMFKEIKGNAGKEPMFNLYYDEAYCENEADIELCVPLTSAFSSTTLQVRTLPAIQAITCTHHGPYESLKYAYKAVLDYAIEKGYTLLTPSREIYIKGPGRIFRGNPEHYITQIILPYEKEQG